MTITREYQSGFELQSTAEVTSVSSATIVNTKAKSGSYSLRFSGTQTATITVSATAQKRMAFHFNHAGVASGSPYLVRFLDTAAQVIGIRYNSGSALLEVLDDAGVLASVAIGDIALTDTWHHLSVDFKIHGTTGWVSVRLNGTQIINFSGDTNDGGTTINNVVFGTPSGSWTASVYVDDVYVDDTVGEGSASTPPDYRYHLLVPNGAGTDSQWSRLSGSANYEMVDDVPYDSDTTYVYTDVDAEQDFYAAPTYTLGAGETLVSVIHTMVARKEDNASGVQVKAMLSDGSNEAAGTLRNLTTSYALFSERFLLAPDGGAWQQADVDALQPGIESNV